MKLRISDDLSLPLDFITERIAFLARTGAGKSGGMRVLAEQMIEAGQFVVHLDLRAGDAWGIRANGTGDGYPVLVMGGEHADVPLQPNSGSFVAEFLVRERISTVLDISDFTKADATRFVTAFAERFYTINRDVVHIFIDEVDVVAGEKYFDPHCLEAIQYLQTKGRKRGIGVTISTQRTAIVNKTVLSQAGTLIAMQATAPRDLKAVQEYLEYVAEKPVVDEIVGALPTLRTREAFVYSPQFLGREPKRITFSSFRTFDSMRTPRPGEVRRKPKKLADIDLSAVQQDMAATIEEVKQNDPVELRRQVFDLRRQLAATQVAKPAVAPVVKVREKRVEVKVISDTQLDRMDREFERRDKFFAKLSSDTRGVLDALREVRDEMRYARRNPVSATNASDVPKIIDRTLVNRTSPALPIHTHENGKVPKGGLRRMMIALAQEPGGMTAERLGIRAHLSSSSGTYTTYLGTGRSSGWITGGREHLEITPAGLLVLGPFDPVPQGIASQSYWLNEVGGGAARMLRAVIDAYPSSLSAEEVGAAAELSSDSGTFTTYLGKLRTLKLVVGKRHELRASEHLFS